MCRLAASGFRAGAAGHALGRTTRRYTMSEAPRTTEDQIATGDPEREMGPLDLADQPSADRAPAARPADPRQGPAPRTEASEIATGQPGRDQPPLDIDDLPAT